MKPLYWLTKPRAPFEWTERCEHAFQQLKRDMTTTPVLAFPNNDDPFILDADAFDTAVGAALYQIQNGVERPVSFASHTLSPAQTRYCTTRKELLSIVVFTRHYKHYLLGREFTVRTDQGRYVSSLPWQRTHISSGFETATLFKFLWDSRKPVCIAVLYPSPMFESSWNTVTTLPATCLVGPQDV